MATPASNVVPLSGNALIDGLVQGSSWTFGGGPRTITYSLSLNFDGPVQAWPANWAAAVSNAFAAWSAVANVQFVPVAGGQPLPQSTADIALALAPGEGEGAILGLGVLPSPDYADLFLAEIEYTRAEYPLIEGDIVFDSALPPGLPISNVFSNLNGGGMGFTIILHEIGHALGLKHSNDDGANARPTFAELGIAAQNSVKYTVMTTYESLTPGFSGFPATPMPLDVLAIQRIYGANTSHRTGNDVYTIQNEAAPRTIWDAGGVDTFDASSQTAAITIDLRPGEYSTRGSVAGPLGNVALAVAFNTTIENAIGGSGNDTITGNAGNNTLTGGAGFDQLTGGAGNDTYDLGPDGADLIIELLNQGTDTVLTSVTYTLLANLENLTLTGSDNVNGTGNGLGNALTGNGGANVLDGLGGADVLSGGAGNDTYFVDAADTINEAAAAGTDTVNSTGSYTLRANIENLTLLGGAVSGTGNELPNTILGNNLDNVLNGGTGDDTLTGGAGNDSYVVDASGDVVNEAVGQGIDLVQSAVSYVLLEHFENLSLTGLAAIDGTGNTLANVLKGNFGANVLSGGAGDDSYYVDSFDTIVELVAEGTDTAYAASDYALAAWVENLTLVGGAISGTGNAMGNVLTANSLASTLAGGGGDDTYVLRSVADVVIEEAGGGTDTVSSAFSYTLTDEDVENLLLSGFQAANGTGNAAENVLLGNSRANVLDGAGGADEMAGGGGDDTYRVEDADDAVTEFAAGGSDLVVSSVDYTLPGQVENLRLAGVEDLEGTGNALNNVLTGNGGDNRLDGGAGRDVLIGGAGDDTYAVTPGDRVVELQNGGVDTVESAHSWTLAAHLENLTLTGEGDASGTGNALVNVITGNGGANVLDGGIGADALDGAGGDDVLIFDGRDAAVDGGAGHDLLRFKGFNQGLDLTHTPDTVYTGIEAIDLTGRGRNSLTLAATDVLALSDTDQLLVDGGATSALTLSGPGWTEAVQSVIGDTTYLHYTAGGAIVLVDGQILLALG